MQVRWQQGNKSGVLEGQRIAGNAADEWLVLLPENLDDGELTLVGVADSPRVSHREIGQVREASAAEKFAIEERRPSYVARLDLTPRTPLTARIQFELSAAYPSEEWETVESWSSDSSLTGPGPASASLDLPKAEIDRICENYGRCRLVASARVFSRGLFVSRAVDRLGVEVKPERYSGKLGIVPGSTEQVGKGEPYNYGIFVERGIRIDRAGFAAEVWKTLSDRRGWTSSGRVSFQQVARPREANTRIILAAGDLVDRLCFPLTTEGRVSCRNGDDVVLNLDRWRKGSGDFKSRLDYRRYLVNHEVGHRIGQSHRYCVDPGERAAVMQQQTGSSEPCHPGFWPQASELATVGKTGLERATAAREPDTEITSKRFDATYERRIELSFRAGPAASFSCRIDAGQWRPCSSPYRTPKLSFGEHRFEVRGRGAAGALDESPAARDFEVVPRRVVFGRSVRGAPLVAERLGDPSASTRVLVVGEIHGDEDEGREVIDVLRRSYAELNGLELWTVMTINPDGHESKQRVNANGVDLNRNFSHKWNPNLTGGNYSGTEPFSEPESRAAARLARRTGFALSIWYHQPFGVTLVPCGRSKKPALLYAKVSKLPPRKCGGFLPGTAINWQNHVLKEAAFVVEFAAGEISRSEAERHARAVVTVAKRMAER